jgi:hypothetical protein
MKASETKQERPSKAANQMQAQLREEGPIEAISSEGMPSEAMPIEVMARTPSDFVPDAWYPSVWDALIGYWGYVDPERSFVPESKGRWLLDEDDFSSEHGYEPGFEGRSEFEHGEFDRWL